MWRLHWEHGFRMWVGWDTCVFLLFLIRSADSALTALMLVAEQEMQRARPWRLSRKDTPRRLVARCQGRRVSKDVCIRTSPFVFSRTETLSDFQRKSSLEWQPQAPDGSGLRNKGKEGRVDGEGRHSFEGFGYEGKRERRKLMRKARSKDGGRFINFGKQVEERRGSQRE